MKGPRARLTEEEIARGAREVVLYLAGGERELRRLHQRLQERLAAEAGADPRPHLRLEVARYLHEVLSRAIQDLDEACARLEGDVAPEVIKPLVRRFLREARKRPS